MKSASNFKMTTSITVKSLKSGKQSNKNNGFVDLVAVQDQKLMCTENNKIEFLRSIQPAGM